MGQIIQELSSKEHSLKETVICLQDYTIVQTLQNGNMILKQSDNSLYYLYHKQLQKTSENTQNLLNWLNHLYNHNYNVLKYQFKSKPLLCASHLTLKVLLEFGDLSLNQILHQKETITQQNNPPQLLDSMKFDSPLQLLNFIKLMISVVEEQREKNKVWIRFHTKNIIFQSRAKCFKYFHLFQEQGISSQTFFAPELYDKQVSETETVFSMGMVLLSLFLMEDCSDCYNYQNHTFCEFIFEEKIEKMKQKIITIGLLGILDDSSQYVSQFDQELTQLILLMTNKEAERLSFAEIKRRYLWLIRKASFSFGVKNQVKSHSKAQPLTSKRVQRNKRHSKHRIGCFSTKEDVHFKNTFSEIDQSDFFSISKSNIQSKTHCKKGKENQVLKWKKIITNKMKEDKQNLTFNSQL